MSDAQNGAGAGGSGEGASKTPADFLKSIKGKPVVVKLNSGVDYRGAWDGVCVCTLARHAGLAHGASD